MPAEFAKELSVVKEILSFSIDAKLFEPGGSLKTISGMSGAAVTNVWLPSDLPPKIIPSDL
jgi:hypothetical protein